MGLALWWNYLITWESDQLLDLCRYNADQCEYWGFENVFKEQRVLSFWHNQYLLVGLDTVREDYSWTIGQDAAVKPKLHECLGADFSQLTDWIVHNLQRLWFYDHPLLATCESVCRQDTEPIEMFSGFLHKVVIKCDPIFTEVTGSNKHNISWSFMCLLNTPVQRSDGWWKAWKRKCFLITIWTTCSSSNLMQTLPVAVD